MAFVTSPSALMHAEVWIGVELFCCQGNEDVLLSTGFVYYLGRGMDYYTIGLLVGIAGIIATLVSTAYWLGAKLARINDRLDRIEGDLRRLTNVIYNVGVPIVKYLGLKGVLTPGDVDLVRTMLRSLTTNPLTETERRRPIELVNKDNLTPEEVDELERLAMKFLDEHMDKEEAWWLLAYAAYKRGETYGKYGKKLTPLT